MKAGIVGAGIVGRLLAFRLAQLGWQISLFEQSADNCSMAAAGLLTPIVELEKSETLIYSLGIRSLQQLWPLILQQLEEKIFFNNQGSLLVSHPQDSAELRIFIKNIAGKLPNQNPCQQLNKEQLHDLEPSLHKFNEGYYLADEGNIDSQAVMNALENQLEQRNINWQRNYTVTEIKPHQVISAQGNYSFDYVFDCRGLGAKQSFADLRGVRGELIFLHAPEVFISRPLRLFNSRHRLYLVPRPDSIYLLGASEIESEDRSPISLRSCLELLSSCFYVHSGFAEARIIKTVTHCRPTLANHLPRIKYQPGLVAINGLYRHGFLLAPALIEEVVGYLEAGNQPKEYPQLWAAA